MKYLGIDYGSKNVGIAVSDEEGKMAFARDVFDNDSNLFKKIVSLVEEEGIEGIVIGESINFSGEPNPIMKQIVPFKEKLEKRLNKSVQFQKEFFTSAEADKIQGESLRNVRKQDRRSGKVNLEKNDDSAAALILRSYLEKND